jgi:hypothetical protein
LFYSEDFSTCMVHVDQPFLPLKHGATFPVLVIPRSHLFSFR